MKVELNQEIIVVGIGNSARYNTPIYKAIVSKIGRKWFYVDAPDVFWLTRDEKFSLEDGRSDGRGYSPEYQVFESEDVYKEIKETPNLKNQVERDLRGLTYKQLMEVFLFVNSFSAEK